MKCSILKNIRGAITNVKKDTEVFLKAISGPFSLSNKDELSTLLDKFTNLDMMATVHA